MRHPDRARGLAAVLFLFAFATVLYAAEQVTDEEPNRPVAASVGQAAMTVEVTVPADGAYYLELNGTVPPDLGRRTIRHTVNVDGAMVEYKPLKRPRGKPWNIGYVPYFTLRSPASSAAPPSAEMLFLQQLHLTTQSRLAVVSGPGEQVSAVRLRPALADVTATIEFSGDSQHIYFPGEEATARIEIANLPAGAALRGYLLLQHLRLADTWGDSWWRADIRVVEAEQVQRIPLETLRRQGNGITGTIDLPTDRFGVLGVTAVIEQGERIWAGYLGAASVVPQRSLQDPAADGFFIASLADQFRNNRLLSSEPMPLEMMARVYKKIGIDWVRCGPNWGEFEPQPGEFAWGPTDRLMQILKTNGLLAMHLAQIAPTWARPDDAPGLQEIKYKNLTIKVDWSPLPQFLPQWEQAHEQLYRRHKDVIRATNIWNEPWEGMGITGWKSTGEHYRRLVQGIRKAVDQADPTIKVVAADSGHNTDWKLFAAGMGDSIDVVSTHYSSPRSAAFALARHHEKELWETETWQAWAGDAASVRHALYYLANGGDKISLWNYRMLFDHEGNPLPATAWTAGVRHMLDGLRFRQMIHPQRPPFVLLFENAGGEDRHVAAVMSTLSAGVRGLDGEFRAQFAGDRSRMRIETHAGLRVLDLLANPAAPAGAAEDVVEIIVDGEPRFIESREPIEQFVRRLEAAVHSGVRPVEILLDDITRPAGAGAALQVTLRNAYAEPLPVEVRINAPGLTFATGRQETTLAATGEQTLQFAVEKADPAMANRYAVSVMVATPRGEAAHEETVHFSLIARGTPVVDGDLSEWPALGAVPVQLANTDARRDEQVEAWFPWEEFAASGEGFYAEAAFAADERHLYMMARVRDQTRRILPSMLAGTNLHVMQAPPADNVYVKAGPIPGDTGDLIQLALGPVGPMHFLPAEELYPPDHPLRRAGSYISTLYKYILYPTDDGGAEVLRVRTPGFYYRHPLPIDYGFLRDHCRVEGAQIVVKPLEGGYVYEIALPWAELDQVSHAAGEQIQMSFLIQDDQLRNRLEWSRGRSRSSIVDLDFEPAWGMKWSSETRWGLAP